MENLSANATETHKETLEERHLRVKREKRKSLLFMLAGVIIIIVTIAYTKMKTDPVPQKIVSAGKDGKPVEELALPGEKLESLGRDHMGDGESADYNSLPPTSGTHFSSQTNWGIHKEPVPEGYQVHNLEHGGILIQYRPDLDKETQDKLKAVGEAYGWKKLILAPYPVLEEKNDKQIALTAWTYLDKFDGFDDARIRAFIDAYRNHGPENVPDNMQSVTLP